MNSLRVYLFLTSTILMNSCSHMWAANLSFGGQPQIGTIASAAQIDTYTFTANANDVVDFVVASLGGNTNNGYCQPFPNCLSPQISVYNSVGSLIGSAFGNNGFGGCGAYALGLQITLPVSGTFSALVSDCAGKNTGAYAIYAQRLNAPVGAISILFGGQPQGGTISSAAQGNTYSFRANVNDVINFLVAGVGGNYNSAGFCPPYTNCLSPQMSIYNSAGMLVSSGFGNNGFGGCGAETLGLKLTVPATGTYTVIVGDCSNEDTGNYNLSAQCFGTCSGTPASLLRSGVLSHIAAGGAWTTVITLINPSSAAVSVAVAFYSDDGTALSLPVTTTNQGISESSTTASLSATINPNATLLITTAQLTSTVVGWADVDSSGPVGGFAIFRETPQNGSPSEGTVPFQTQFPSTITMPYDDTAGFVTGVALANLSTSTAEITATIWDDKGNHLGAQTFTIAANGHTSFVLPTQIPMTTGIGGIVQFQSSGGIAGLGLRFSPFSTFTSVPTM